MYARSLDNSNGTKTSIAFKYEKSVNPSRKFEKYHWHANESNYNIYMVIGSGNSKI